MKILIEKHVAEAALRRVVSVVEKRNTISILGNVMITAKDGRLTLRTAGLDMEAVETVTCEINAHGETTVDAVKLYDIVRNFPPGAEIKMEIPADDPRLAVSCGRSKFRLPVTTAKDFPVMTVTEWPISFEIDAKAFGSILAKASWAAAVNEARYALNGTYVHVIDGNLRAVATNAMRLAYAQTPTTAPADFRAILPSKMTNELQRRLMEEDGDVTVNASSGRISVSFGDAAISSKLIEGDYVDYPRMIPVNPLTLRCDADALTDVIKGALLISEGKVRSVKCAISGSVMTVTARAADADSMDQIEVDYTGDDVTVGLNGEQVLNALTALNADVVEILLSNLKRPTIFRKVGFDSVVVVLGHTVA